MTKLLIISIFLTRILFSNAETDIRILEQYCQIIAAPSLLSNQVNIDTHYGDEKIYWRDTRLKIDAGNLKKIQYVNRCFEIFG